MQKISECKVVMKMFKYPSRFLGAVNKMSMNPYLNFLGNLSCNTAAQFPDVSLPQTTNSFLGFPFENNSLFSQDTIFVTMSWFFVSMRRDAIYF